MTRRRINAIPFVVDVDGHDVPFSLRPQRSRSANWTVRWKLHGNRFERSTGTKSLEDAKRIARQIIREDAAPVRTHPIGMTVAEFEIIQQKYHARSARAEAGESTFKEFLGVWRSFLRVCPVKIVHDVTEHTALKYLHRLQSFSKTENCKYKEKSPTKLSINTIHKHIRTLAGAWNLIREGHSQRVGGLDQNQLVQRNPWQAIRNNVPHAQLEDDDDPVQFELENMDLDQFLDQFKGHPVGELFIITSLWCAGRINEMTHMKWSWIKGEHVVFPKSKTKGGRRKVVRLPPLVMKQLEAIRDFDSPYVFANWVQDVTANAGRPTRVQPFDSGRMRGQMEKLIPIFAEAISRPEVSHHALRRTAMELSDEAELRKREKDSADKLQTTVLNKGKYYTKKLGKKAFTLADGLYSNLTKALHDYPALANRLGCESLAKIAERDAERLIKNLSPLQRQHFAKKLLEAGGDADGQIVG